MDRKKKLLLALLSAEGEEDVNEPIEGSLRVMKQVFLAQKDAGVEVFNFVPYKLGPCSFSIYNEMEALEDSNLVNVEEDSESGDDVYSLTDEGVEVAEEKIGDLDPKLVQAIREKKRMVNGMDFDELISYVYEEYPNSAEKSEVKWVL